jgi:DNA modification methylase
MEIKKISDLKAAKYNPRKISPEALAGLKKSVQLFGDLSGITFNKRTSNLVSGHQRVKALKETYKNIKIEGNEIFTQSGDKFKIRIVDWPLEKEKAANQAANNQHIAGEYTLKAVEILEDIKIEFPDDFGALNFDNLLDELKLEFDVPEVEVEGECDEDEVPDVYAEPPITKRGDLWELGRHRLLCGDATSVDEVEKLMGGEKVDCLMTDPPYGVNYSAKNEFLNNLDKGNSIQEDIKNDAIENYRDWFGSFLSLIPFANYNTFYIWMSGKELHNLRAVIEDCKYVWGDYLVWVKNNHVLGRKDYNAKHEFCVYGWKERHKFYGDFSTTILEYDKPLKNKLHPTMKPVSMLMKLLCDGSPKGSNVLDLFGGSGSTLIACEKTNRKCYMMEIDEYYCDVIVQRYIKFSGDKNIKLNDVKYVF